VAVKKVGGILKKNLDVQGYNVGINNDPVAGQVISHIHFHIIPRKQGDGLRHWPEGKYKKGEAEKILKRITHNIN
ncbi:HIT family protein, partial [Patescibacteria group bacterium]|nr:HIT family protein [Patescibacteria group bacterium]MBU1421398.1 HIT family protein [Patescibacteria group bacterium]MBU2456814.1 HIT family protein [Patescibacteria group bacterium]